MTALRFQYLYFSPMMIVSIACALCGELPQAPLSVDEAVAVIAASPSMCLTRDAAGMPQSSHEIEVAHGEADPSTLKQLLRAIDDLVENKKAARRAIPVLIRQFPVVVHGRSLFEQSYSSGAGSFDDWVMTKVMGLKNHFMLTPPFLDGAFLQACEDYIDVSEQHEMHRPYYNGGVMASATVTIRVSFVFHAGACALYRITGQNLGADRNAWQTWYRRSGPGVSTPPATRATAAPSGSRVKPAGTRMPAGGAVSFDELLERNARGVRCTVTLSSGKSFTGTVLQLSRWGLQLDVDGSRIPIARDVISSITAVR